MPPNPKLIGHFLHEKARGKRQRANNKAEACRSEQDGTARITKPTADVWRAAAEQQRFSRCLILSIGLT